MHSMGLRKYRIVTIREVLQSVRPGHQLTTVEDADIYFSTAKTRQCLCLASQQRLLAHSGNHRHIQIEGVGLCMSTITLLIGQTKRGHGLSICSVSVTEAFLFYVFYLQNGPAVWTACPAQRQNTCNCTHKQTRRDTLSSPSLSSQAMQHLPIRVHARSNRGMAAFWVLFKGILVEDVCSAGSRASPHTLSRCDSPGCQSGFALSREVKWLSLLLLCQGWIYSVYVLRCLGVWLYVPTMMCYQVYLSDRWKATQLRTVSFLPVAFSLERRIPRSIVLTATPDHTYYPQNIISFLIRSEDIL